MREVKLEGDVKRVPDDENEVEEEVLKGSGDEVKVVSVDTVEPTLESNSSVEKMTDVTSEGPSETGEKDLVESDIKESSLESDESEEEVTEKSFQPEAESIESDVKADVESEEHVEASDVEASPEQVLEESKHDQEEEKASVSTEGWRNMISNGKFCLNIQIENCYVHLLIRFWY